MTFQASEEKGKHFLDLLDNDLIAIELSYTKGGLWLQSFGHSNLLCAHATRAITNHAPIGEYRLWFFPSMDFLCPYNNYPIESRRHILHECERFNGYWNPRMLWNALDLTFYFSFIYFSFDFIFLFLFLFLLGRWRRHMTRKSHDRSHDVAS